MTILLTLLLCFALPGLAGGVLLSWSSPVPARPGALLTRALSCGVFAWLVSSGLLGRTVGITRASGWVAEATLGLAGLAVLGLPRSRAVLRQAVGEAGHLAAVVGVAAVSWLPIGALVLRTTWAPLGSTPWFYWNLATQVAAAGHVPATTTEWGTSLPFLDDYHLFTTGTAMLLAQGGQFDVRVVQAVVLLSVVLLACGASLLAVALGSGRLCSLVAIPVVVASGVGAVRMTSYRPEAFALGLTLLVVAAFVDWFRHGERGSLVAGCLLGAALANVHGIALLTAAVLLVAWVVASLPRRGAWRHLGRAAFSAVVLLAGAAVLALLLGSASGTEHAGGIADTGGLADPTWEFVQAIHGRAPSLPPSNLQLSHGAMSTAYKRTAPWISVVVLLSVVVLAVAAFQRRSSARRVLLFAVLSILGLCAVGAVFAFGWSSYVPRRTGSQRLVSEASLLVGPFVACALGCVPAVGSRVRWSRAAPGVVLVAFCAAGLVASSRLERVVEHQRPSPGAVRTLASLQVRPDAVVLTNAYTEGYLNQVLGAQGLLEGRAPYTFPRVLDRANTLLRQAHDFYRAPRRHLGFLTRNDVSYVVVSRPKSYSLGTGNTFVRPVSRSRLAHCPGLSRVVSRPDLVVYKVDPGPL